MRPPVGQERRAAEDTLIHSHFGPRFARSHFPLAVDWVPPRHRRRYGSLPQRSQYRLGRYPPAIAQPSTAQGAGVPPGTWKRDARADRLEGYPRDQIARAEAVGPRQRAAAD